MFYLYLLYLYLLYLYHIYDIFGRELGFWAVVGDNTSYVPYFALETVHLGTKQTMLGIIMAVAWKHQRESQGIGEKIKDLKPKDYQNMLDVELTYAWFLIALYCLFSNNIGSRGIGSHSTLLVWPKAIEATSWYLDSMLQTTKVCYLRTPVHAVNLWQQWQQQQLRPKRRQSNRLVLLDVTCSLKF